MAGPSPDAVPDAPPSMSLGALARGAGQLARRTREGEFAGLVGLLGAALALLAFVKLAGEVLEGDTGAFDRAVMLAMRNPADAGDPLGPRWLEEAARDVTALGSHTILGLVTVAVAGYLALSGRRAAASLVFGSVATGAVLSSLLKLGFARPRPDLVPHAVEVYTASFPSGHAMLSAVVYLSLGALLMRFEPRPWTKPYVLAVAILITFIVGLSRVYLGVHWPTDVLAGWCVGAAWALGCWLLALRLRRRAAPAGTPAP